MLCERQSRFVFQLALKSKLAVQRDNMSKIRFTTEGLREGLFVNMDNCKDRANEFKDDVYVDGGVLFL